MTRDWCGVDWVVLTDGHRWAFGVGGVVLAVLTLASPARADDYRDPALTAADKAHWAFVPPVRPPVQRVKDPAWVRTPVDAFVLAKLEAKGLAPAAPADRRTLLRRLNFDLTGLPPTAAEVEAFAADPSPDAYEKQVERLLASPHFGERWAQHWLDVVRFAESNGYEADGDRPHAWRYRDYVVRSFNDDKPYDQFLAEQLAGDLLAAGRPPRAVADLLVATGFHRCGPAHVVAGNVDAAGLRNETLTEMTSAVGAAVLGLTVACARCHDHKFDPVSLGDYYRLEAFFAGTAAADVPLASVLEATARRLQADALEAKLAPVRADLARLEAPARARVRARKIAALDPATRAAFALAADARTPAQNDLVKAAGPTVKVAWDEVVADLGPADRTAREALKQRQLTLERDRPAPAAAAWAVAERTPTPDTFVLHRGDLTRRAGIVVPAGPRVLAPPALTNRLDLAKWLTAPAHPLTARVVVNRLWQHHFGRGLVGTPNDFGTRGDPPSHSELLDWLARELVEPSDPSARPWALKRLHRLLVTSSVYRQGGGSPHPADPDDRLLARMPRRRLDAEATRDAMLAAGGELNRAVGGPSVRVPLDPEVYDLIFTEDEPAGLWPVTPDPRQHARRSLYLLRKRNVRLPVLEALDQPDAVGSCAVRGVSTFAPQALILVNGPFAREQAAKLAALAEKTGGTDPAGRVRAVYRHALQRDPRPGELSLGVGFLASRPLSDFALAVLNVNEFVFVE